MDEIDTNFIRLMLIRRFTEGHKACQNMYRLNGQERDGNSNPNDRLELIEQEKILFVIRMGQCRNWSNSLNGRLRGSEHAHEKAALKNIIGILDPVYELRNFHVHEDEYMLGKGRNRTAYEQRNDVFPFIKSDGLSSISFSNVSIQWGDEKVPMSNVICLAGTVFPSDIVTQCLGDIKLISEIHQKSQSKRGGRDA